MIKKRKYIIDNSIRFYRNHLMERYMKKWIEGWQKAKR